MSFFRLIWNEKRGYGVLQGMEHSNPSHRQILDEDLQIIRVTLATIITDVRHFSARAADAVQPLEPIALALKDSRADQAGDEVGGAQFAEKAGVELLNAPALAPLIAPISIRSSSINASSTPHA